MQDYSCVTPRLSPAPEPTSAPSNRPSEPPRDLNQETKPQLELCTTTFPAGFTFICLVVRLLLLLSQPLLLGTVGLAYLPSTWKSNWSPYKATPSGQVQLGPSVRPGHQAEFRRFWGGNVL